MDTCHYESMYPSHLLLFCLTLTFQCPGLLGLGANRKVQNTGEPIPIFFSGLDLVFFKGGLWHEEVKHSNHSFYHHFRNINPKLVLVQPRKTSPFITERLMMGRKESNQTNKTTILAPGLMGI